MLRRYEEQTGMANDPHWPFCRAVVAMWPHSAESHAEDLPRSIAACTPPQPSA